MQKTGKDLLDVETLVPLFYSACPVASRDALCLQPWWKFPPGDDRGDCGLDGRILVDSAWMVVVNG
jgi:hypothetical protein